MTFGSFVNINGVEVNHIEKKLVTKKVSAKNHISCSDRFGHQQRLKMNPANPNKFEKR
jgi:hypothetical protein